MTFLLKLVGGDEELEGGFIEQDLGIIHYGVTSSNDAGIIHFGVSLSADLGAQGFGISLARVLGYATDITVV